MYFWASREIFHSNKFSFLFYGFFIGIPAFLVVFYIVTGKGVSYEVVPSISAWLFLVLCGIYVFVFTPALQFWGIRKSLLSNPSANQTQNYQINKDGVTVMLVEQNAQMALQIAHRGYVLETGHVTLEGPGKELLSNPKVRSAYLGLD